MNTFYITRTKSKLICITIKLSSLKWWLLYFTIDKMPSEYIFVCYGATENKNATHVHVHSYRTMMPFIHWGISTINGFFLQIIICAKKLTITITITFLYVSFSFLQKRLESALLILRFYTEYYIYSNVLL